MNSKPPASELGAQRTSPFLRRAEQVLGPRAAEPEESFDALTDLFLGEIGPARRSDKTHSTAAPIAEARPVLRLTTGEEFDDETASQAVKLAIAREHLQEKPVSIPASASPVPMREPIVECIVLGNLPVLASAWASQYVREISAAAGRPVASIRVQGGFASIELVGEWAGGSGPVSSAKHEKLEDALRAAACLTDRWIIRCDSGQETAIVSRPLVRVVTVLTGVDEMARMAALAAVKGLSPALPADDGAAPLLRLAVMGAADETARATGRVLAEAAEKIVNRSVQHVVCSAKIRSTRSPVGLFSGATDADAAAVLGMIEHLVGSPAKLAALTPSDITPRPAPAQESEFTTVAGRVEADLRLVGHAEPETVPATAAPAFIVSGPAPTAAEHPASIVQPVERGAAPAPAADIGALASHVPGLRVIALRCPYADAIEIAIDADGAMHLLARAPDAAAEDATLAALLVASSWSEAHAGLITAGGLGIARASRPLLHLFTDAPKRSRRLLETNLRVHLLAPVAVAGQTAWFCTELN